jgi:hypothetical protein
MPALFDSVWSWILANALRLPLALLILAAGCGLSPPGSPGSLARLLEGATWTRCSSSSSRA